jgi:hypothetical protein
LRPQKGEVEDTYLMLLRSKAWLCSLTALNSDRAIEVNIQIMRTFVKLREMIASHKDLAQRLDELEKKYDKQFSIVFEAIRPEPKRKKIGFLRNGE